MRILTVIPITNNPRTLELTYYSLNNVPLGAIVQVPMRNKEVPALVVHTSDASDMKAVLRGGDFALKRIGVDTPRMILPKSFMLTADAMANYYATSIGSIISAMLPKAILVGAAGVDQEDADAYKVSKKGSLSEVYALQAKEADRVAVYKNTVREAFAKRESVLLVTPTIASAQKLHKSLSTGLTDRSYILSSKSTKAQQVKVFKQIHDAEKVVLLVATAKYAALFRPDVGTIIIEDEASSAYNTLRRPYMNSAEFIKTYAKVSGIRLILGSTVLSVRTHLALREGTVLELTPQSTRTRSKVKIKILDVRKKEDDKKPFSAIDESLHKAIGAALAKNKSVFILAPRRGLAPLTVCRDCKTPVLCSACDTPITLRKKADGAREFLCYKCGETQETDTVCTYCSSWRLDTLGIGIELIGEELAKAYPKTTITYADKTTTKTDKQVQDAVTAFTDKGGILLGSQVVLPFLDNVDVSAIASLDAMLSVPSFEIDERVFALILKVQDITSDAVYVQTRMPERSVLMRAAGGDIISFVRDELKLRKTLKYPPHTVMIKITRTGSKRQIITDFQKIMPRLEPYGPRVFKQFYQITRSKFALHALLRIKTKDYPSHDLTELLKSIQPMFEVRVGVE